MRHPSAQVDGRPRMSEEARREAGKSKEELARVGENTQHCWKWKAARVKLGQGSEYHREHKGGADGWRKSVESLRKVSRGQKSPVPWAVRKGAVKRGECEESP